MIVTFMRSSSISTFEMCEMKYFFQYVLGMKDKTNKKAIMGTITHRALQVLGDKKVAMSKGLDFVENDDIKDLTFEECDNFELITELCFDYYKKHEEDVGLSKTELKTCTNWLYKATAYNDGVLDPRNQDIFATELFFDITVEKDWAKYDFTVQEKQFKGHLGLKGTIDVIAREGEAYFQVLDYKTGKRLNWATGKEKTHDCLYKDKQLLLYYYALKNMYPDWTFYVSIYYINDGGIYDMVFDDSHYRAAEQMIEKRFKHINRVTLPKQISREQSHWKCTKLCKFSEEYENSGKTTCKFFHDLIKSDGMNAVTEQYANVQKIGSYGSGGGRLEGGNGE